jgi:PhzF family phenazine biosynthesis protein
MIDVFGSGTLLGNPLAVVHDAEGLTAEEMQAITRWMNLSETTFLLPPTREGADYRVRIFTLIGERRRQAAKRAGYRTDLTHNQHP